MNQIAILKNSVGRTDLADSGAVARPFTQPACNTRATELADVAVGHRTGLWESTPGSYLRQVAEAELMHFIAGDCTFTPEGGEPVRIEPGDTVFFPANTRGRWDMHVTVRKVYAVFAPGGCPDDSTDQAAVR